MVAEKKKGLISHGMAAQNRKARFDYTIKEQVEAGLVLIGPEVKSLRLGRATLAQLARAFTYAVNIIGFSEAQELKSNSSSETTEYLREAKEAVEKLMGYVDGNE